MNEQENLKADTVGENNSALFGVWIEGGDKPGRWLRDFEDNDRVWAGAHADAQFHADERYRMWRHQGLTYQVRELSGE